jgi:thymidylate synthase ThyX
MSNINATIVADSINPQGDRITTMLVTFPRFILAELNTHRMFSRNSASSRAIPFEKMVKMVQEDPFIPIAWQKDHKGMQGTEYFTSDIDIEANEIKWNAAKERAIKTTISLHDLGVTKQLCNRLLEPFMWHTVIVTATEWENFFKLRCPQYVIEGINGNHPFRSKKDVYKRMSSNENFMLKLNDFTDLDWLSFNKSQAEIHIQALAEAMWDAMNESTPKQLKSGEYHIPMIEVIED